MQQVLFALPERDDFAVVAGRSSLLQAVDFALQVGALPVVPEALQGPDAVRRISRCPRLTRDISHKRSFSCT